MTKSLVTGGSGYIALQTVNLLLSRGHEVHTTVRSLSNEIRCKPLRDLQAAHPGRLHLFEADLLKQGSFGKAMAGCEVVYHIASPFLVPQQIKDGMKDCVEPAIQGTRNVLGSVNETESVRRVVLTSSVASMYGDSIEVTRLPGMTLTEDTWNVTSSPTNNPYAYSKVAAEKTAWEMQRAQSRWDLVVICPGMVLGPSLSPESVSGSIYMVEALFRGDNRFGCPDVRYPLVDVRDVAAAHVAAGENAAAHGRYLVAHQKTQGLLEIANMVRPVHRHPKSLPTWNFPKAMMYVLAPAIGVTMQWTAGNIGVDYLLDNSRSKKELGIEYRSEEQLIRDHYEAWLATQGGKK